jgi:hypothetical protein
VQTVPFFGVFPRSPPCRGSVKNFAQENVGENYTIDYLAILNYVEGAKFHLIDAFDSSTIEENYRRIEEEALAGLPLWRFIKSDSRIIQILEDTFTQEVETPFTKTCVATDVCHVISGIIVTHLSVLVVSANVVNRVMNGQ